SPFLQVVRATGFPQGEPWLWVGPSGPHIIGKVVRELARQTGSMDPFSVDFDPRWAKRLADGSLARQRYLDHVTEQALDVLEREHVGVLFTTPPALAALARRMSDRQREAIHGVHYGGLSMTAATLNEFRAQFPRAVHLAGYGNTLFGVVMEVTDAPRQALDYFPLDDRVLFHVVDWEGEADPGWPPRVLARGETGRGGVAGPGEGGVLGGGGGGWGRATGRKGPRRGRRRGPGGGAAPGCAPRARRPRWPGGCNSACTNVAAGLQTCRIESAGLQTCRHKRNGCPRSEEDRMPT